MISWIVWAYLIVLIICLIIIAMRDKIKLVSSAGTGHYYTTDKNKRTTPANREIKKYDPVVRKHVVYKESKIK